MKSCVPFCAYRAGAFWPDWWVLFLTLVLAHNQAYPEPADGEQGLHSGSWSLRGKQLTCSKRLAWKPWSKSYCIERRAGEGEAAQSFKGKWIEIVASVSVLGLEWSEQESSRSHFMAELNADEALLAPSPQSTCLTMPQCPGPLCVQHVLHIHTSPLSPFLVFSCLKPSEHYFLLPYWTTHLGFIWKLFEYHRAEEEDQALCF